MLLINEIYPAICGESRFFGYPCTLVRLTGCHIRCGWCDSEHSFAGGEPMAVQAVVERIDEVGFETVLVTGGEPLLQPDVIPLMAALIEGGRRVLLETSGALGHEKLLPLTKVPAGVHRIVDVKAPGSGIPADLIDWEGIAGLGPEDEIKIVLADRNDYEWARDLVLVGERLPAGVTVSFSPVQESLEAKDLAEWILADGLDVRFQIQLHRVVWPDVTRGV
jgi:7-carboxy-7-deazaguanine synthase